MSALRCALCQYVEVIEGLSTKKAYAYAVKNGLRRLLFANFAVVLE